MILPRALLGANTRLVILLAGAACGDLTPAARVIPDTSLDTTLRAPAVAATAHQAALPDPVTDSVAQRLVFVPNAQRWFVASARGGRVLVDLGRADIDVAASAARKAAFHAVAPERAPLQIGARMRVRGAWRGATEDAAVSGFDIAGGRIVAVLDVSERLDSAASGKGTLVGTAIRADPADSVRAGAATDTASCDTSAFPAVRARARVVRDSLLEGFKEGDQPQYERLLKSLKTKASITLGCFGTGNAIVAATTWGGDYEWVRETVVLLTAAGRPKPLPVRDYRFRAHELLAAFDADGDGRDDVAARATTTRAGATVVLRLTDDGKLERLAAGFAWER